MYHQLVTKVNATEGEVTGTGGFINKFKWDTDKQNLDNNARKDKKKNIRKYLAQLAKLRNSEYNAKYTEIENTILALLV